MNFEKLRGQKTYLNKDNILPLRFKVEMSNDQIATVQSRSH